MVNPIYSIGHSDLSFDRFGTIIRNVGVTAVADVRTTPFSRRSPWFGRDNFEGSLADISVDYRFLGMELGGRPADLSLFDAGVADYQAMAQTESFQRGIRRLQSGMRDHVIALVCSERDPLHCHRCLLVGRALGRLEIQVSHLAHDAGQETQDEVEERLLLEEGMSHDHNLPLRYRIEEAYKKRARRVAFSISSSADHKQLGLLE